MKAEKNIKLDEKQRKGEKARMKAEKNIKLD